MTLLKKIFPKKKVFTEIKVTTKKVDNNYIHNTNIKGEQYDGTGKIIEKMKRSNEHYLIGCDEVNTTFKVRGQKN